MTFEDAARRADLSHAEALHLGHTGGGMMESSGSNPQRRHSMRNIGVLTPFSTGGPYWMKCPSDRKYSVLMDMSHLLGEVEFYIGAKLPI
jgi:hypothetical protein